MTNYFFSFLLQFSATMSYHLFWEPCLIDLWPLNVFPVRRDSFMADNLIFPNRRSYSYLKEFFLAFYNKIMFFFNWRTLSTINVSLYSCACIYYVWPTLYRHKYDIGSGNRDRLFKGVILKLCFIFFTGIKYTIIAVCIY